MKWIHWKEKEPENGQWIVFFQETDHKRFPTLEHRIRHEKYVKFEGAWEHFLKFPEERLGYDYWMPQEDFPFPPLKYV